MGEGKEKKSYREGERHRSINSDKVIIAKC